MANTIQIKRSSITAVPASLAIGELAYSSVSDTLFIGESGSVVTAIGGGSDVIKLNGIESGATADQTGAEIKALYEGEADTNALTDALLGKLNGIETSADVTDTANVDAAGAVMNTDTSTAPMSFVIDEDSMASDLDTKVPTQQSVKSYVDTQVSSAVASGVRYRGAYDASANSPDLDSSPVAGITIGDMYTVTASGTFFAGTLLEVGDVLIAEKDSPTVIADWTIVQANLDAASIKSNYESNSDTNAFTDAFETKLTNIETAATADQTDAEIKTAYENNADTNALTDTLLGKLNGIETSADNYGSWTISDGSLSEAIATTDTLVVEGAGSVTTAYAAGTNTMTVTGVDTIDYISGASFNGATGEVILTGVGSAGASVNLDGRYFIIDVSVLDGGTF